MFLINKNIALRDVIIFQGDLKEKENIMLKRVLKV